MNIVIIEDEFHAASRLSELIKSIDATIKILVILESVANAKKWFSENPFPDLIFSDIQLSDGISFEIFDTFPIHSPIIFTTSYDEYALKAFKVKSIDYLLKPIKILDLENAITKYKILKQSFSKNEYALEMESFLDTLAGYSKKFKSCFLVRHKDQLVPVQENQIAYFYATNRLVNLTRKDNAAFLIDYTLNEIEKLVNPSIFFQVNRQFLIHINSIDKIHTHFNGMLKLELTPSHSEEIMVSRDRVKSFKEWLESSK